jgi:hypothetical protein
MLLLLSLVLLSLEQKIYNMHTDKGGNTNGQECHTKRSRKGRKYIKQFIYRGTTNVEHEMCADTGSSYGSLKSKERFKGKFGKHTRKKKVYDRRQNYIYSNNNNNNNNNNNEKTV